MGNVKHKAPPIRFSETIQQGEKHFFVTYREYQLCEECEFFPAHDSDCWKRFNPLCKSGKPMKFLEPQDIGDAESGNYGFVPLFYTCERFEANE